MRTHGPRDRDGVLAELEAFAAAPGGDPRLMVKPARLGSSVGMTLAHTAARASPALELAFRYDDLAIVERYLAHARDLEVSVIGNGPTPSGSTDRARSWPATSSTTTPPSTRPACPRRRRGAELPAPSRGRLRKLARDAYRSLGTEGFARVDFLVADEELVLSEINTIPGFTPISLFPTLPAEAGFDFTAVCLRILDLALDRDAARVRHA